ncbi:structural maintenance of chromosomes protein 6 [Caerostris darwini]|uniref:Structural maintenance of chromosomes protein 6 n=1 Tax=Caerostris darwini TaxID=1538125 RepID=A0AAV4WFC0_9ARAC|nr:structural maintenance of chromosomes protein 6 [Caerostris darwini]
MFSLFLELKEPKWADAVDLAIGGRNLLNSFCVDNHSDSKILRNILMKYYSNIPSIIVSPFESQVFDVRGHEAHSLFPTVLDMLTIKNPVVANCLIDQAAIEKKILVEDRNEMKNLLQVCPQNCRSAYFLNCDQICYEPTRLYSAGNFRPRSNLTAIRLEDIKILEEALQKEREAVETKKVTLQKLPLELNELSTEIKDLNNKIGRLSTRLKLNYSEIKELQYAEKLKDVNCLLEDLQLMQSQYETKQAEIDKYTEKVSELEKKKKENEHELNTKKILLQSCCNSYKKYCSEVKTLQKNQDTINIAKERLKTELKTHEKKCVTCLNKLNELIEKTDNSRSNAEQFSERINTVRSVEEIKHLIKETKKVIELQSDCDREDIKNKYNQKLEALQIAEHELERIEEDLKLINEMLRKRKSKISQIITESERYIQYIFTSILNGNGYTGSLEFDDTNKKLKMVVAPTKSCRGRNNHNSLSGGERSFVTIAFLIALWENSRMPFKILDEYDVFMDSSNRQLSFKLLNKKAKTMKKTQFIFLSPLDLPQIEDSSLVEIIRMAPPKRKHNETAVDTE